ncbi:MAG: cupin domain-containing protein [Alphaproteobacteria bacterium]|nr:cupin domain-containing protein [Alphaproteobacteria bacterium]
MSRHPAPDELLLDYAAGALPEGPALVIGVHVALDPEAQRTVEALRGLGGALLEGESAEAMDEALLEATLARLDETPVEPPPAPPAAPPGFEWVPEVLRRYLPPDAKWRRMFGGFDEIRIELHGDPHRVSLLRLAPGESLPMHRHVASEYAVVLQGGFTDITGNYGVGDFAIGPGPVEHQQIADPGEDCIALIVVEKPIVLTGFWAPLLNPLFRLGLRIRSFTWLVNR